MKCHQSSGGNLQVFLAADALAPKYNCGLNVPEMPFSARVASYAASHGGSKPSARHEQNTEKACRHPASTTRSLTVRTRPDGLLSVGIRTPASSSSPQSSSFYFHFHANKVDLS